jgi:hypothetical protein
MRDHIRVLVLGAGSMGRAMVRLLLEKEGVKLVGVWARAGSRTGMDIGELCGFERPVGLAVESNLGNVLRHGRPDVAIQATCSELSAVWPQIQLLLEKGVNVISIAEEMTYPYYRSAAIAGEMDALARAHDSVVLGAGINPGFVLDLLIVALSGVCARVDSIHAARINDLSPYGATVLRAQGVGLSPAAFAQGLRDGTVVGHIGFPESMHLIASALGWTIDRIEQSREPIIATARHETPTGLVEPGQVAGCRHRAWAYRADEVIISFNHPQLIGPEIEGMRTEDRIEIRGAPDVRLAGSPEIPGGDGTAALAVNMIPRVLTASPGLRTMVELPVPSAVHGDMRRWVHPREAGRA